MMSEQVNVKGDPVICIGADIGTMNIVVARSDMDEAKITRNVFMKLDSDDVQVSELSEISYVEGDDNELYIIGSDAFRYANIFGQEVSRPMEKGLISPKEIAAIDILTLMIKDLIGDVRGKDAYCSYSVPAQAIDEGRSVTYHENVFARILKSLGVNYSSVNEAMAIIYSECAKEKFSGIAISFGAGMANCLAGETKIPLLNGEIKTIKELADEYNSEKFWVYSCKEDGKVVPGLAHSPRKTGTREVVRVYLDNGTYFDCTEDHLIMKRDGEYIKAGDLKENDSLMLFADGIKNQYTKSFNNHKVIKVEKLNVHRDVYDLTVDKYHNFAIDNGIFVHNCAVAYKGIQALVFSTARSGDWIDQETAASLGMVPNRVTSIKEKYMKFSGEVQIKNKKTRRVLEALYYYHKALIEYTVKKIIKEFDDKVDIEVDEAIPIVISGGTSMPEGFVGLFKDIISGYDLPFEVSEIRRAKNPLTAVANGLLVKTMSDVKGMK